MTRPPTWSNPDEADPHALSFTPLLGLSSLTRDFSPSAPFFVSHSDRESPPDDPVFGILVKDVLSIICLRSTIRDKKNVTTY